jgi:integrase/recombinase XerC
MARIRPPVIADGSVPVVSEDALRKLLATCAGKRFEDRRDTALIMSLIDTGTPSPTCGSPRAAPRST